MELNDELVYRSDKVIVGKAEVSSENSVVFDGETVLAPDFKIVYFDIFGRWFAVDKVWNLQGEHTGYYCDIVMPPRLKGDWLELTDLFLDLWVSPDLRYRILDEDELEDALRKGWIEKEIYDKAREELQKLIGLVESKRFPPLLVKNLERKLGL
jgi:predicted RNA-binding protein associated with RNAse of E/G family